MMLELLRAALASLLAGVGLSLFAGKLPLASYLRRKLDLCWFVGVPALTSWMTAILLRSVLPRPLFLASGLATNPILQAAIILLFSDFSLYWLHRLVHRVSFLAKLHATHHARTEITWLIAHRQHPVEALLFSLVLNAPLALLPVHSSAILTVAILLRLHTIYVHLETGHTHPSLRWLIADPAFHHVHHHRRTSRSHYGSFFSFWDHFFGTVSDRRREQKNVSKLQ
jgi:sterol desaturase/sphingolipid hydroxylase (fatty acid hydroxylase superfamily)